MTDRNTPVSESMAQPHVPAELDRRLHLNLRKTLHAQPHNFVLDVEIEAASGFTILFGPSGAGKTTLLDCIAGLQTPDSGSITMSNRAVFDGVKQINVATAKRRVGYVLQSLALFPHMSVAGNIAYGLVHLPKPDRKTRVDAVLAAFRIAHLGARHPHEVSGGEAQRVALARTLVTDPEVLLLDEPLAALDAPTKSRIIHDLREWNRTHSIPILYVTHSREEVFALGERVIVLEAGRVITQGTPHEVMSAPQLETVAQLAGFENTFDVIVEAIQPERGTMLCRILGTSETTGPVQIETPLVRASIGSHLRLGIRAGDILLATVRPNGLSARNIIRGHVSSVAERDVIVSAIVDCGVEIETHLTLAARDALQLDTGKEVWLVIKTHSCHLMQS